MALITALFNVIDVLVLEEIEMNISMQQHSEFCTKYGPYGNVINKNFCCITIENIMKFCGLKVDWNQAINAQSRVVLPTQKPQIPSQP